MYGLLWVVLLVKIYCLDKIMMQRRPPNQSGILIFLSEIKIMYA